MRTLLKLTMLAVMCMSALSVGGTRAAAGPLFTVGIEGGFTGASMHATVYPDGTVDIQRQGGGRTAQETRSAVPLSRGAVNAAVALAMNRRIFSISKRLQNATFGADLPSVSLTVYTSHGTKSVHATGTERSHVAGTGRLFPIWGIFYALAGYPPQIG